MKCRMILPVGVLTYLVCFGGVNASAFDWFRLAGEEAVLEEPAPLESEGGKLEATQKGMDSACQKSSPCQKGCEPFALPCRPRLLGWGKASCEPTCGVEQKCGPVSQKDCGPVCQKGPACQKSCEPFALHCRPRLMGWGKASCEPTCGVEQKCGPVSQKDCGPVCQKGPACQKGCEPFALPCRPRLMGWGKASCEPTCGVEQKCGPVSQKDCGPVCQKGPACQKSCEPFALPCRPRLMGWGKGSCEPTCGVEQKCGPVSQKDCGPVCQKGPACQKSCEPFALPCRPRLRGWGKIGCETESCCEPAAQKDCGAEQKSGDCVEGPIQKAAQK